MQEFETKFEAAKGKKDFKFGKFEINAAEFCLDVTLFQVLECGYKLTKTFKALARVILLSMQEGTLELPPKYRQFVIPRLEERDKKKIDLEISLELTKKEEEKKIEKEKLEKSFNKLYNDMLIKNKSFKESLEKRAKVALETEGVTPSDPVYNLSFECKMRFLANEDFMNGEIINFANSKSVH